MGWPRARSCWCWGAVRLRWELMGVLVWLFSLWLLSRGCPIWQLCVHPLWRCRIFQDGQGIFSRLRGGHVPGWGCLSSSGTLDRGGRVQRARRRYPLCHHFLGKWSTWGSWQGWCVGGLPRRGGRCRGGIVGFPCICGLCGQVSSSSCTVRLGDGLGKPGLSSVCRIRLAIFGSGKGELRVRRIERRLERIWVCCVVLLWCVASGASLLCFPGSSYIGGCSLGARCGLQLGSVGHDHRLW